MPPRVTRIGQKMTEGTNWVKDRRAVARGNGATSCAPDAGAPRRSHERCATLALHLQPADHSNPGDARHRGTLAASDLWPPAGCGPAGVCGFYRRDWSDPMRSAPSRAILEPIRPGGAMSRDSDSPPHALPHAGRSCPPSRRQEERPGTGRAFPTPRSSSPGGHPSQWHHRGRLAWQQAGIALCSSESMLHGRVRATDTELPGRSTVSVAGGWIEPFGRGFF